MSTKQQGFAVLDAFVAMVVFAIATAGFSTALYQLQASAQTQSSRRIALSLLDDLAQRLLIHDARFGSVSRIAQSPWPPATTDLKGLANCSATPCHAADFAAANMAEWATKLEERMPTATVSMVVVGGWQHWVLTARNMTFELWL